ncbi:MAG: hypothetical protein ACRDJC_11565 [Thermomicrobiales bacterium]
MAYSRRGHRTSQRERKQPGGHQRTIVSYRPALVGLAYYRLNVEQHGRRFRPDYALHLMRTRRRRPELAFRDLQVATVRGHMYAGPIRGFVKHPTTRSEGDSSAAGRHPGGAQPAERSQLAET